VRRLARIAVLIACVEHEPVTGWLPALSALADDLATAGHDVRRASDLATAPSADAYLVIGPREAALDAIIDAAAKAPDRLKRTVLIGAPLDFRLGFPEANEGTIVALLERHRLGGALGPEALTRVWQEAPSWFAGPTALMHQFRTNPIKALQSETYANWVATRGRSLAEFLCSYLPVLVGTPDPDWSTVREPRPARSSS
jgi:hypothetical protein